VNFSIQMIDTDGPHNGPYPIGRNEGPATMAEPVSYDDFAKLELRVAKVLEARPHPNADKLLLLQVDVGDQQKQIVAGIREHCTPEQLVGKLIGGTVGVTLRRGLTPCPP